MNIIFQPWLGFTFSLLVQWANERSLDMNTGETPVGFIQWAMVELKISVCVANTTVAAETAANAWGLASARSVSLIDTRTVMPSHLILEYNWY